MDFEFIRDLSLCTLLAIVILAVIFAGIVCLSKLNIIEVVDSKCNCCGCQVYDAQELD